MSALLNLADLYTVLWPEVRPDVLDCGCHRGSLTPEVVCQSCGYTRCLLHLTHECGGGVR